MPWSSFPQNSFLSCSFYYFVFHSPLILAAFIAFVIIAKKYKLRQREDIVPYHQFAEDFVEKDMK